VLTHGITTNRASNLCGVCHEELPPFKGFRRFDTVWKKGNEWHKECWYKQLPNYVCKECGLEFPSTQSTQYREHWLVAHKPPGEIADVKMYLPDGMINDNNIQAVLKENEVLKQSHVECLRKCADWLDKIGVRYFISDGTLLGAFRENGKMINIDIDTDLSIMEEDFPKLFENAHLVPDGFMVDALSGTRDWATCVNEPFDGVGAKKCTFCDVRDYSHIVKETQAPETDIYTFRVDEDGFIRNNYAKANQAVHLRKWKYEWIFPLKEIEFEGTLYTSPNEPLSYLKELYGYIGHNAYWDPEDKVYRKLPGSGPDPYD